MSLENSSETYTIGKSIIWALPMRKEVSGYCVDCFMTLSRKVF